MSFSMSRTWTDSFALVRGRWLDLLLVAVAICVISALITLPMMSQWLEMAQASATAVDPAVEWQRAMASMQQLMGLSLLANLLQLVGYGAMVALLGPDRPNIGKALLDGLKATPTMFLAIVFLIVGMYVAMFVVVFALIAVIAAVAGTAALTSSQPSAATLGPMVLLVFVLYLALIVGILYLMLRFVTLIPVAVIERQRNPFTLLGRSWSLTRKDGWRILGFWVLIWIPLLVLYTVIAVAMMPTMFNLDGAVPADIDLTPMFVAFVPLGLALAMLFSAIVVATYRQLTEEAPLAEQEA